MIESPFCAAAHAALIARQTALMDADHTYFHARDTYEKAVCAGAGELEKAQLHMAYLAALLDKDNVYKDVAKARAEYKASKQEMTVRV